MPKLFRDALLEALERTGAPLKKVAEGAGVSYDQLKKLRQRDTGSTNVDDAVRVANFFGMTLDEFIGDDTAQARSEAVALYSQLTEAERTILRDAARGRTVPAQAAEK
ncbi:hypothetical protein [Falsirhodobacter sp. 1013]|uniref:hypothetical protein n=1 Tax=Falsirhodobacter sp. 1013 TaxID=3417566 RepID=UPI003EBEDF21